MSPKYIPASVLNNHSWAFPPHPAVPISCSFIPVKGGNIHGVSSCVAANPCCQSSQSTPASSANASGSSPADSARLLRPGCRFQSHSADAHLEGMVWTIFI